MMRNMSGEAFMVTMKQQRGEDCGMEAEKGKNEAKGPEEHNFQAHTLPGTLHPP